MTKIPILYYTVYGHLETIARAGAEGVRCFKGEGTGAGAGAAKKPITISASI